MNYLSSLNPAQKEAVEHKDGPLLLIAGAGSGKTKALTCRIAHLIEQGIPAWQILAVTFTNKAAKEMAERVALLHTSHTDKAFIGTFHSICAKILRSEIEVLGYEKDFIIYDSQDQVSAMKQVLKALQIDDKQWKPKSFINAISSFKNELQTSTLVKSFAENDYQEQVANVYVAYEKFLKKNNALDFDDLIGLTVQIFQDFPGVLDKYQKRWQYISVDEYQDTNKAQYRFIQMLCKEHGNLCVIGDPDQSIYAFRGAKYENILQFQDEFPHTKVVKLEQNYRSTSNILLAANDVIDNNKQRFEKKMWTDNTPGEKIQVWQAKTEIDEAQRVAKEVLRNYKEHGQRFSSHTILYRTNTQSRVLEEAFLRNQIPYKIIGGLKFYARKEVKDILAYLRILINPADSVSLLRIINVPARKIGNTSLIRLQAFAQQRNLSLFEVLKHIEMVENLTPAARKSFHAFLELYNFLQSELQKQPLSEFIDTLITETGYRALLSDKSVENQSRLENLEELKTVAAPYDIYEEESLNFFLEEVSLVQDSDNIQEDEDVVTFMTVHSSKGLEFDNVFIVGLEESIFPHSRSADNPLEVEEERRLMYVAMTRARQRLYLVHALSRTIFGQQSYNQPSRFLSEISEQYLELDKPAYVDNSDSFSYSSPVQSFQQNSEVQSTYTENSYVYDEDSQNESEMPEYKEGMRVSHAHFGEGVIIAINGHVLTVSFGPGNVKRLAANIVPLKIL